MEEYMYILRSSSKPEIKNKKKNTSWNLCYAYHRLSDRKARQNSFSDKLPALIIMEHRSIHDRIYMLKYLGKTI